MCLGVGSRGIQLCARSTGCSPPPLVTSTWDGSQVPLGCLKEKGRRGFLGDCQLTVNDPKVQRVSKSLLGSLNTETREDDQGWVSVRCLWGFTIQLWCRGASSPIKLCPYL